MASSCYHCAHSLGRRMAESPKPVPSDAAATAAAHHDSVFSDEFIAQMPKTDLHVHLDGSIRVSTVIELAKKNNVSLPSYDEAELKRTVFKESYNSLEEYLECFKYTVAVMQTPEALQRVAYEFACDNYAENVLYFEVRFAPQLHASEHMDIVEVLRNVNEGLARAKAEYNQQAAVLAGTKPPHEYGIICSAMRFFLPSFSAYFKTFCEVHKHEAPGRLHSLASMALVCCAIVARDEHKVPVVALDIAGPEDGYPAEEHIEAYSYAHKRFLNKTVHAGEGYGPESIFQAITDLHADRIGHGYHLFSFEKIRANKEGGSERYMTNLVQFVAEHRVTLEVCLSSNLQTIPELNNDVHEHAFKKMLDTRLSVTLCTDNRTVSHTNVTKEYKLAAQAFNLTRKQMKDIVIGGFKRSFFPQHYVLKRAYVRKVINFYETLEASLLPRVPATVTLDRTRFDSTDYAKSLELAQLEEAAEDEEEKQ